MSMYGQPADFSGSAVEPVTGTISIYERTSKRHILATVWVLKEFPAHQTIQFKEHTAYYISRYWILCSIGSFACLLDKRKKHGILRWTCSLSPLVRTLHSQVVNGHCQEKMCSAWACPRARPDLQSHQHTAQKPVSPPPFPAWGPPPGPSRPRRRIHTICGRSAWKPG